MTKSDDKQIPSNYLKISRALSDVKENELAQKVCDRGLVQFPQNANLHSFRGNILIKLFNKTKKPEHLTEALFSYEKSLSLNPDNYIAALTAAKLYIKNSAFQKAREKLDLLFANSPGDVKATDLLNLIKEKEKTVKEAKRKNLQPLIDPVEEMDDHTTSTSADYDLLISHLHMFKKTTGLKMVLLADIYGVVLKCFNHSDLNPTRLGIIVSNIFRSSQNAITKTGLGIFQLGVLISPDGYNYIVAVDTAVLLIVGKQDADHKDIERQIQIYLHEISP